MLQDEITREVVEALRTKLLPGQYAAMQRDRPPGGSLKAYNDLLQGRFYDLRDTEADTRKAVDYYTEAVELDPHYALAWSYLSGAWTNLHFEGLAAQEAISKARAAADRALTLAPDLVAAHLSQGTLLQVADFDWRGAETEFRRALELSPNDGEAKYALGGQLAILGEVDQAINLTRQALDTDPLRARWYGWLATYLSGLNRFDEAERAIRKAIELQPVAEGNYEELTIIEIQRGDAQKALEAAQKEHPGSWQDVALALARQTGSDRSAADAALKTLIEKDPNGSAYQIAQVYALRGDANATFDWLDRALSIRDRGTHLLLFDPFILRYKDDPRFATFCRKVGLPVPGEAPRKST